MNDHIKDTIGKRLSGMEASVPSDLFDRIQQNRSKNAIWLNWFRYRLHGYYTLPLAAVLVAGLFWGLGRTKPVGAESGLVLNVPAEYQPAQLDDPIRLKRQQGAVNSETTENSHSNMPGKTAELTGSIAIENPTPNRINNANNEPASPGTRSLGSNQKRDDKKNTSNLTPNETVSKPQATEKWGVILSPILAKSVAIGNAQDGLSIQDDQVSDPDLPQPQHKQDLAYSIHRVEVGVGVAGNQWLFSGLDNRLLDARKTSEKVGMIKSGFVRYVHRVLPNASWIVGLNMAQIDHAVFTDFSKVLENREIKEREITVIDPPNPDRTQIVRDTIYTSERINGEVSTQYSLQAIELPVGFRTYRSTGKVNLGFSGYAVPGLLRSVQGNVINANFEQSPAAEGAFEDKFTFGIGASAGIYGPLASKWSYFVEPTFSLTLTDHSGPFYLVATRRSSIGLNAGVSFSW